MPTYQHQRTFSGNKGVTSAQLFRLARAKGWDGKPETWGTSATTGRLLPVKDRKVNAAVMHLEDKGFAVAELEGDKYTKKIHVKDKVRTSDRMMYYPAKLTRLKTTKPKAKRTTRTKAAGVLTHTHSHAHKKPATKPRRRKSKNGFASAEKKIRKWFK